MTARHRRSATRSARAAALLGIALLIAVSVAIFGHVNPISSPYELRAQVANATQLRADNPVRIAGVTVGRVTGVSPGPDGTSIVGMTIDDGGLPLHEDASIHIEPRLALEGNFAIRLSPGRPTARTLPSGSLIPLARTSGSVQLDQVVDVFDNPTRRGVQSAVEALATGLGPRGDDASGADDMRAAVRELDGALADVARVTHAARGRTRGDLPRAVRQTGAVTELLSSDRRALADISGNISAVGAALVAEDGALAESVRRLRPVLLRAPATLRELDRALPRLQRFAVALRPSLDEARTALPAMDGLARQLSSAAAPKELPRLVTAVRPLVNELPALEALLQDTFPFVGQVAECIDRKVVPALSLEVPDLVHSTGRPAYQDLVHAFTRLSAANPSFDANGRILRAVAAGGEKTLTALVPPFGDLVAGRAPDIQGVAPTWLGPGVDLPWEPGADCREQDLPDLTKRRREGLPTGMRDITAQVSSNATSRAFKADRLRRSLAELSEAAKRGGR